MDIILSESSSFSGLNLDMDGENLTGGLKRVSIFPIFYNIIFQNQQVLFSILIADVLQRIILLLNTCKNKLVYRWGFSSIFSKCYNSSYPPFFFISAASVQPLWLWKSKLITWNSKLQRILKVTMLYALATLADNLALHISEMSIYKSPVPVVANPTSIFRGLNMKLGPICNALTSYLKLDFLMHLLRI